MKAHTQYRVAHHTRAHTHTQTHAVDRQTGSADRHRVLGACLAHTDAAMLLWCRCEASPLLVHWQFSQHLLTVCLLDWLTG